MSCSNSDTDSTSCSSHHLFKLSRQLACLPRLGVETIAHNYHTRVSFLRQRENADPKGVSQTGVARAPHYRRAASSGSRPAL